MQSDLPVTFMVNDACREAAERAVLATAENILKSKLQRQGHIHNPMDAADYVRLRLGALKREEFHVLWLDTRHRILDCQCLFVGTVDTANIYPREVVRAALDANASAAILAHNHPSGSTEPSAADRIITDRLKQALGLIGVRVLDHLIIGDECVSMADMGLL